MTDETLRSNLEALKILFISLSTEVDEHPATDKESLMNYGYHIKGLEAVAGALFKQQTQVAIKDRSMETMALLGTLNLYTADILAKLTKQHEEIKVHVQQENKGKDPLVDGLIEALREAGVEGEVKVLGLKNDNCTNPNCPIHGKKEPKEEQKN